MNETMKLSGPYGAETPLRRWWNGRSYIQQRLIRMCMSILVMVICFPLYYLGFFGSLEGPLNPSRIGERLAAMGVTQTHSTVLFLSFLIIAVSWNWVYNLVSMAIGSRLTCTRPNAAGKPCGAEVERKKEMDLTSGGNAFQYVCSHGHRRREAQFRPVKKGAVSHTIWILSAVFCGIVFVSSY